VQEIRQSIKSYYQLSLAEGEGVGTAYEYYAKAGKLGRFLGAVGRPKTILIAGLPERYGFSMDFFLLSEKLQSDILVIDDRDERVQRAREIVYELAQGGIMSRARIRFLVVPDLGEFGSVDLQRSEFDLALSCEVLQRLDLSMERYLSSLWQRARNIALFVPNRGNSAHAKHSGLRSLSLQELLNVCRQGREDMRIHDSGYVDMPPFPPGINRSQEKRDRAAHSLLEGFLMNVIEGYCSFENLCPPSVSAKFAHIAYVMAKH
jgi:hypothetical protein